MEDEILDDETFEIRDIRGGFLWMTNRFFDKYVKLLQPSSFIVYCALARKSDNDTQTCYPSYETLSTMTGLSRSTVAVCLQELKETKAINWLISGRHNTYYLLGDTSPDSGLFHKPVRKTASTSPENGLNQSGGLDSNKTHNKTYNQDLILSPSENGFQTHKPKSKEKPNSDPRREQFIEAIHSGYARRGWPFGFNAADGANLKKLLTYRKDMTVAEFRKCLHNYFESEGVPPGGRPCTYLMKLPDYWAGPKNQYGKSVENHNGKRPQGPLEV